MTDGRVRSAKWRTGLVLAVMFAIVLVGSSAGNASAPGPGYLNVRSFSAVAQNDRTAKLSATTDDAIPRRADSFIHSHLIVGIAWADVNTGKVSQGDYQVLTSEVQAVQGGLGTYNRFLEWWPLAL